MTHHRRTSVTRAVASTLVIGLTALGLAACGGSDGDDAHGSTADDGSPEGTDDGTTFSL